MALGGVPQNQSNVNPGRAAARLTKAATEPVGRHCDWQNGTTGVRVGTAPAFQDKA